jgi:two-component system, chemotaxis family, sensor kinase CheA
VERSRQEYLVEAEDVVEQLFLDLENLREQPQKSAEHRQLLDSIFRRVHNIKGSAASFGLSGAGKIAHEFEALLAGMRSGRTATTETVLNACEAAAAALADSLRLATSGQNEPSRQTLFETIRQALENDNSIAKQQVEAIFAELPADLWQSLTAEEKERLGHLVEQGSRVFIVETKFNVADFDQRYFNLKEKLVQHGDVVSTLPTVVTDHPDQINFRTLFATEAEPSDVEKHLLDFPGVELNELANAHLQQTPDLQRSEFSRDFSLASFVRTNLDQLDQVISSAHELLRSSGDTFAFALSKIDNSQEQQQLQLQAEQFRQSFLALEEEIINLRMTTIGAFLKRAERAGQAAARAAGKPIDIQIRGLDIRADKLLCEAVADAIVHLVRNAVDHGIEPPDERLRAGKEACGRVLLEAMKTGGRTCIRVIDDGRGIDPQIISRAATDLGIIDEGESLNLERSLRLIFRPGFSTSANASTISGRGVGLDVVETAVEQAGGEVRVSGEPGCGAHFEIHLPVTFGLLRASLISSAGNRYCIDPDQSLSLRRISAAQIEEGPAGEEVKSEKLPIMRLRRLLGQDAGPAGQEDLEVLICEIPDSTDRAETGSCQRVGLIVDSSEGTEEVLVRHLGRHAGRWQGIVGATELRDGTVALVLDLPVLVKRAVKSPATGAILLETSS